MATRIRKNPVLCLLLSLERLLVGRLTFSKEYVGTTIAMENGEVYQIFRHVNSTSQNSAEQNSVLIVRFKFAKLSYSANKFVSQFPMLLITGFPGFQAKIYAVNPHNGYWLGLYQWESKQALEDYKQSLVLQVMNRRAIEGSVTYREFERRLLTDYIEENKISDSQALTK